MTHIIKVSSEINIPSVPNFFLISDGGTIPIEAITDSGLEEIGKLWTQELLKKAKSKRANKINNVDGS